MAFVAFDAKLIFLTFIKNFTCKFLDKLRIRTEFRMTQINPFPNETKATKKPTLAGLAWPDLDACMENGIIFHISFQKEIPPFPVHDFFDNSCIPTD